MPTIAAAYSAAREIFRISKVGGMEKRMLVSFEPPLQRNFADRASSGWLTPEVVLSAGALAAAAWSTKPIG